MPVWHARTRSLREKGLLRIVGVVQDQHPDRARLFMQWQQLDWPVLVDALNRTGARVVPLTWLLDEHGIVRAVNPRSADLFQLVKQTFPAPSGEPAAPEPPPSESAAGSAAKSAAAERTEGDRLFLAGDKLSDSIAAYEKAIAADPKGAESHFRLGVALRRRFESPARQPGDFRRAAEAWSEALELDPGQYVWRRRLQQYGPRLGKPYNFFAWVARARDEIDGRAEVAVKLTVEPSGTEIQGPSKATPLIKLPLLPPEATWPYREPTHPDPAPLAHAEAVTVPTCVAPGQACKVHVVLHVVRPEEGQCRPPARVRVQRPEGWGGDILMDQTSPNFASSAEHASHTFEFELHVPEDATPGPVSIPIRVMYNAKPPGDGKTRVMCRELVAKVMVRPAPARKPRR